MLRLIFLLASVLIVGAAAAPAQTMQSSFPISAPPLTELSAVPLALAAPEAEITERISIQDGHFVKPDGTRMRFFGTTLWYSGAYPDSAEAVLMARQLRSYGINAVRFNLHDYSTWTVSTFLSPNAERFELSADQMARFDWLMYQFKLNGIYVHFALHSRRTAGRNDAVTNWDTIPDLQRGVIYFDPELKAAQRAVTRNLLTHKNPHTGLQYKDDPTLAFLDLVDNNSFFWVWRTYGFEPYSYGRFSYYHSRLLHAQWADYLRKKYKTDQALNAAWSRKATGANNLISSPGFEDPFSTDWTLNVNGGAQAALDPYESESFKGELAMRVRIGTPGGAITNVQLRNTSIVLEAERLYEISFAARTMAQSAKTISMYLSNPATPYNNYGINNVRFLVMPEWQQFSYKFRSTDDNEFGALLRIMCGQQAGDVVFDDFDVRMIDEDGLIAGETLKDDQIGFVPYEQLAQYSQARVHENLEFFNKLVEDHFESLHRFIRDTLGCDALVTGNNTSYMLNDLYAQRNLDFNSVIMTWDYVRNSGTEDNWFVSNVGMLQNTNGGNIAYAARHAEADKPMIISQMMMPFPTMHMNEMLTVWPAYANYQDFDGLYVGLFSDSRSAMYADSIRVKNWWITASNPAFMSMLPSAGHAFRNGLVQPAQQEILLEQTPDALLRPTRQASNYFLESSTDNRLPLFRKTRLATFEADFQTSFPQRDVFELSNGDGVNTSAMQSDTDELLWNADEGYISINTDRYKAVSGMWSGEFLELGELTVNRIDAAPVGTFTWISLDEDAIEAADESLITMSSRAANSDAVWRERPDAGVDLTGGWGNAPTVVEALEMEFLLASERDTLLLTPLDKLGNKSGEPRIIENSGGVFRIRIDQADEHALWFHVELRDREDVSTGLADGVAGRLELSNPFPNPADARAQVIVRGNGSGADVSLDLVSVLGTPQTIWSGQALEAAQVITVPVDGLANGAYRLVLRSGEATISRQLIVRR